MAWKATIVWVMSDELMWNEVDMVSQLRVSQVRESERNTVCQESSMHHYIGHIMA